MTFDDNIGPPALGKDQKNPTHSANFGVKLAEKLQQVGVPNELRYLEGPAPLHQSMQDFVMDKLLAR